ncbi:DUF3489 domain-containing protein [Sphingomonas sp. IW22]|uniref:DUF3489 domain-containing protein n=1 Tax=Sphingomonas sp. IW22 TaxID=3242489 RepID=UPI00351FEE70
MTKLSDLQTILLSGASQRDDGNLMPIADGVSADTSRIGKAIGALIKSGYAEETSCAQPAQVWRSDGDVRFGAAITKAGLVAIGIEPEGVAPAGEAGQGTRSGGDAGIARRTKAALVLAMLQRDQGATLAELVEATRWLPHTMRAALTGLRKKGHAVVKGKRDGVTCYTVGA